MLRYLLLLTIVFQLSACGSADSPEAQVRKTVDAMEAAAEDRDAGDVMAFVADDFRDAYGQGPDELNRYLYGYFIANQSLHLLTRIDQIEFPASDEARLKVTVGAVSREADAAKSWNLAAEVHVFEVTMRRQDDDWKVTYVKRRN
ncbi:MAG TPA: hypothetical protein VIT67_13335 [Povalibacter sp.]